MGLDFKKMKAQQHKRQYNVQLQRMRTAEQKTSCIEHAVNDAIKNLKDNIDSFVIYGEPQSGKTEMMIALTARLLDEGYKTITILLNDNIELLNQNLERFGRSRLNPRPENFSSVLDPIIKLKGKKCIIFCKKNARDLSRLIGKIGSFNKRIVIDDEGDYATPNSRINKDKKTKINALVEKLIGKDKEGIYIGVTATPTRLDLNRTFDNYNKRWVNFPTHESYTGQDIFFPADLKKSWKFQLTLLEDEGEDYIFMRKALFGFFVNVAYLNLEKDQNYCFLIHTSGKVDDHERDQKNIQKIFNVLNDDSSVKYKKYWGEIYEIAKERYLGKEDKIVEIINHRQGEKRIAVLNTRRDLQDNLRNLSNPPSPFTIVIGGNIISRGVTFNNLLSMFFTRDVKGMFTQDTYIQRARMFGSRKSYLRYFELTIPKSLYKDWYDAFVLHRVSLAQIKSRNTAPTFIEKDNIITTNPASIKRDSVITSNRQAIFPVFYYDENVGMNINNILKENEKDIDKLELLCELLGDDAFPSYLFPLIIDKNAIAIHKPRDIIVSSRGETSKYFDTENILRSRGFLGNKEIERLGEDKHHHFLIVFNLENKRARLIYKHSAGRLRFLRAGKNRDKKS